MRNEVVAELTNFASQDTRVLLATADLGYNVLDVFFKNFPRRYINVGIAEQNLATISAGLALEGNMVFTYSIGNFPTLRCIEQIRNCICYHNANVKILAVGGGFAYGSLGMTHHATEDIAMMRALPNMKVYVPGDALEAVKCFQEMCKFDGPAYLRMARGNEPNVHEKKEFIVNRIIPLDENGNDIIIFASGTIVSEAVKLQRLFKDNSINSSVYSVPVVKPIDAQSIIDLANTSKLIITIEEHNVIGGLGSAVSEVLAQLPSHAQVIRIGLNDEFTSIVGNQDYLREVYGLSAEQIYIKVMKLLEQSK